VVVPAVVVPAVVVHAVVVTAVVPAAAESGVDTVADTAADTVARVTSDGELVALVRAAQEGDTRAMNALLGRLAPYVGRLCGPIALDDGPDAAQEALVVVFRQLGRLRDPEALYGWVRVIAVREAVRVARRGPHPATAELDSVPAPGDPQLAADVADVLRRLTPEHRAILTLRDLEGLDERTAAGLLAIEVGTVKSRLHRARQSFRKAWER
jgi:RNA polymerase sigma-70 factor (ECF subfamily)